MKTIIITTKKSMNYYQMIYNNWFANCSFFTIRTDSYIVSPDLQPEYNRVYVKEQGGYRVCLPSCLNPQMPQDKKVDYILSIICAIIKKYNVLKSDVYLLIHSGDLFSTQDARGKTGPVLFDWLNCSSNIITQFKEMVEEKHIYQFNHGSNDVSELLITPDKDEYLWFCKSLIKLIEE